MSSEKPTDFVLGGGIGREVALTLASRGVNALFCADISLESAKQTAETSEFSTRVQVSNFAAQALQVDVTDEESVQQMIDKVKSISGRVDYFVNTAGVSTRAVAGSSKPPLLHLSYE